MEKESPLRVTVIGVIMLLYGIIIFVLYGGTLVGISALFSPLALIIMFASGIHAMDGVIFTILSAFILIRRNWARRFTVVVSIILLLCHLPHAIDGLINPNSIAYDGYWSGGITSHEVALWITYIPLLLYVLFIYSLTRPKIKEQFR